MAQIDQIALVAPGKMVGGQVLLRLEQTAAHRPCPGRGVVMQQPVARFQIQDVIGGQQLHAAAHLQGDLSAAPAADTLQRAVQLCAELVVADGLEHKIQRIDLIAAYGILCHIRHKNQHHIGVQQPDALRRGHTAQRRHLNIEKNNIKPGAVRLHDLGAVRKGGHFQQLAALLRVLRNKAAQLLPHSSVVLDNGDLCHGPSPPFLHISLL